MQSILYGSELWNGLSVTDVEHINRCQHYIAKAILVEAIRENSSECVESMKFCLVVVYVMENSFSYGPNLLIEIGVNGSHFKNDRRWISLKYFKKS